MRCTNCNRRLYYHERVDRPQELCFPCAATLGVERLCDRYMTGSLRSRAARVEPWWRWTVYLEHAVRWAVQDAEAGH